jgi:tetratricopeptide (TPR) repeat protein/predicted MPP superfamily phosphohydrolase
MGRTVRIFHISDLHGRARVGPQADRAHREAPFRYRVLGPEWDDNLAAIRDDGRAVDLVVFTGDLGDRGDATDYAMGVELLQRTCAALEVPRERLFVVPGNHDIARGVEHAAWEQVRAGLARAPREGSDWMAGGEPPPGLRDGLRAAILQRAAAFWTAVTDGLQRPELAPRLAPYGGLGYQVKVQLAGLDAPLWIIGLDTAWLAGDEADRGALQLTEHQVELRASDPEAAIPGASLPGFRLALMHHPFADLGDGERARRLLADRVDLVLHGHQHEPVVEPWASPDHDLLVLAAGCLYEGEHGHRYPNACQVIDLALTAEGRPERAVIRFRGWAERNGLFWGDDGLLYRSARGGRLALRRHDRGWVVDDGKPPVRPWQPAASELIVGRDAELAEIDRAISAAPGARVAVVAVQGMAGVGKSFLVEQFCARHRGRFGAMCRWVLDPMRLERADAGLREIAHQAGLDPDRTPLAMIPGRLVALRALIHIDNVDSPEAAELTVELLDRLDGLPAIVTGRYRELGTTPGAGWERVVVECLDEQGSVALVRAELGAGAPAEAELRALAVALGGLPLALHLAAGYLRRGFSVPGFLERLRAAGLALKPDRADPLWRTRSRGIVSASFDLSKQLFLAEAASPADAARGGASWAAALSALGWAAPTGFGRDLGPAITALSPGAFEDFIDVAASLSLVRRLPSDLRPNGAWSVHPLFAELLRADLSPAVVDTRVRDWVVAHGDPGDPVTQAVRWAALSLEYAAVRSWLASADDADVAQVLPRCWPYASSHGPIGPWLDAARRACERQRTDRAPLAWAWAQLAMRVGSYDDAQRAAIILTTDDDGEPAFAAAAGLRADILQARGEVEEALRIRREHELPVYERRGDVRAKAVTMGQIADVLQARGEVEEALRIRREDEVPAYERLGEVREKAVTMGKIADLLQARGEVEEALRIHREDELPVYERLGEVREKAVTMGKIADILQARGEVEEALRIRREHELPVYERLGEVREKAVTMGQIADLLQARGEVEEALRIRREHELPVYERLGDVREKAVTLGKIADILQARGEVEEALRIHREHELPVYERLGDVRSKAVTMGQIADILQVRGEVEEALRIRREHELPVYERLGDVRSKAVTMGKIADILQARGEVEEALRIHREDELPVYERLGDVRSKAMTMGKIADILQARGEVEEALRIRREDELPVYERLQDVWSKAVTLGQIADILQARGEIEEALRICREDVLPVMEPRGGPDLVAALATTGVCLIARGRSQDLAEARSYIERAAGLAQSMRMAFPDDLLAWLASSADPATR